MAVTGPFGRRVDVAEPGGIEAGDRHGVEQRQEIPHLQPPIGDGFADLGERRAPVHGAKGFEASLGQRGDAEAAAAMRAPDEFAQEIRGKLRHVAGNQKIPLGFGVLQSRAQPADGTQIGLLIGKNRPPKAAVERGVAENGHGSGRASDGGGGANHERNAQMTEQRLVASHAGAAAAGQDKPRFPHERIITSGGASVQSSLSIVIRSGYNCLKQMAAVCFLAAAVLAMTETTTRGAEAGTRSVPSGAQAAALASRVKSVVRVDAQTGRLVRVLVPMKAPAPAAHKQVPRTAPDPAIQALVEKTAKDYNVSPALVNSVISVESGFDPQALSWKGAQGIMQLMPATARRFGVSDAFDVKQNVEGGVRYLRFLQDTFKDDKLAIAAYNAGEGAVAKYNGIPPYRETVDYVRKVGEQYERAKENEASVKAAASAPKVAQPPAEDQHPRLVSFVDERGQLHIVTEQ